MAQKINRNMLRKMILQEMRSFMNEGAKSYDDAKAFGSSGNPGIQKALVKGAKSALDGEKASANLKGTIYIPEKGAPAVELKNPDVLGDASASKVESAMARAATGPVNNARKRGSVEPGETYRFTLGSGMIS